MSKKSNPYDPTYVMKRDSCSYDEAVNTIADLKEKNAWNRGKKIQKANPYDPTYVMKRDNCSYDEALHTIEQFKRNKATTLENFILRYGEEEGTLKYHQWKDKSLGLGHLAAIKNGKSQSKFSPSYYIRKGHNEEEANELAKQFMYENSSLHIEYYLKRGKSLDYARKKIRGIHDKKIGKDSYAEILRTSGMNENDIADTIKRSRGNCSRENLGDDLFEERIAKTRKTMEDKGIWVPLEDMTDYEIYRREVWKHTNLNDLTKFENYENRALAGTNGGYHLDHKFSISRGYLEGVSPDIIGSLRNLHFIPWEENVKKQGNCSILLEELL